MWKCKTGEMLYFDPIDKWEWQHRLDHLKNTISSFVFCTLLQLWRCLLTLVLCLSEELRSSRGRERVKEGTQNTALWGICADGHGGGGEVA